jgi:hypothetical protein
MTFDVSASVRAKLSAKVPPVSLGEIEECFINRENTWLEDTREEHLSDPVTLWFVAETNRGRKLKIVFIPRVPIITIRSAYDPSAKALAYYQKHSKPL